MERITCRYTIIKVLKASKKYMSNEVLRSKIIKRFNKNFQNNTIVKELAFLKREGIITSRRVPHETYVEYKFL